MKSRAWGGGTNVRFEEFEARAWELWEKIPERYKAGVDGLVVVRDAKPHPSLPDIYTLGECVTEDYLSDYAGPETTRSVVVLYYGSFWRLSRLDEEFDWDEELWETLTHELQHHLESLAAEAGLVSMDYAADENFKRREGEPFDPLFYRSGERLGQGWYQVEEDHFLDWPYRDGAEPGEWIEFEWEGERYRVPRPARLGDVCFVRVDGPGLPERGEVFVVLVRRKRLAAALRGLFRRAAPEVREAEATAEPAGGQG
jgi:hypothetical protein